MAIRNTRQCMATSNVAYKQSFGFDAPPYTYADFEESDALVFIGSNLCIAHPIIWQRVMRNKKNPEIIVDRSAPHRDGNERDATSRARAKVGSSLCFTALRNLLIHNGWIDREFIKRTRRVLKSSPSLSRQFTPDRVALETGLSVRQLFRFAETIGTRKAVSFWWTMGVNQGHESTRTAQAVINLALMTGNIGRPGTGANSVTGQCNAMGSRLFANASGMFGGRDFMNAEHRTEVARALRIAPEKIPAKNSLAYDQIMEGIEQGKIKGLWVIATNTAHSWIDSARAGGTLDKLEFLVVQDLFSTTDTAQKAHLILPAAGWGEKEGTFINSERRFGHVKKVSRAPGQALSDFNIFRLVAEYWGCSGMFSEWTSPQAVFQILKRLSAGRPCDVTGIEDYRDLDARGGMQWPWSMAMKAEAAPACERRLFADEKFFTPDGRAKFLFDNPRPVAEPTDENFPFVLLSGRGTSAQWHTNTRTGKSAVLRTLYPANAYAEINPADATKLGLAANATVAVVSRRGRIECTAVITRTVQPGHIFIPMHYDVTNKLTRAEFDPHSRQPSYKHCAVRLEKIP